MIKVNKGNVHGLGGRSEVKMIETAHLSALVFTDAKVLFLSEFESPAVEEFLVLVSPFPSTRCFFLNLFKGFPFLLRELLKLYIIEFIIIEKLAEDDVKIGRRFVKVGFRGPCF